ncbi:hypothetical protein L596_007837 [Steinernema carpocapsae]|uniref:Tr-type G domain-containing protein n=1 Tax=Steinernema carpocapsae TaxID=34508 RepID=A0A4V6XWK4_STECR|nr:hypothetical protein L596_007837 [Steinernema carpocapsae]
MSRHRNIRNLDFDDEIGSDDDADYYGRSYEEEVALSPNSERFIYRRDGMNPFFPRQEEIPEVHQDSYYVPPQDTFHFEEDKTPVEKARSPDPNVPSPSALSQNMASFTIGQQSVSPSPEKKDAKNGTSQPVVNPVVQQLRVSEIPQNRSESKSPTRTPPNNGGDGLKFNLSTQSLSALTTSTPYKKRSKPEGGKENINLVIVGHVDAGKSTMMGHLLCQLEYVDKRVINKYKHESSKLGKGSFAYAWVLDETEEERDRGVTMDIARTYFETENKKVVLLDAPGHKDFIPNMITGASQADAALLVVNATKGEFETGFDQGGQTREHVMLLRSFGVTRMAVAVNKMDTVGWNQDRFDEIIAKMKQFLVKQAGYKEVKFIPLSGLDGTNLTKRPAHDCALAKWYDGPSLVEVIDGLPSAKHSSDAPLRVLIHDVTRCTDTRLEVCAKVEAGHIEAGDKVVILPGIVPVQVKQASLENSDVTNEICFAGDQCLISLSGQFEADSITAGHVISRGGEECLKPATRFLVRMLTFDIKIPFIKGTRAELFAHSMCCSVAIVKMNALIDKSTGKVEKEKPRFITRNSSALLEIQTESPVALEPYTSCKTLGRITLRDKGETIAAGIVEKVLF